MHVILDLSRLLAAGWRGIAAGIDRVELAYARHFAGRACSFTGQSPWGFYTELPRDLALGLVAALLKDSRAEAKALAGAGYAALAGAVGRTRLTRRIAAAPGRVFIIVSHAGLHEAAPIAALKAEGARFLPMLHDLIPITHPEFTSRKQIERHPKRIETILELADAVLISSRATGDTLAALHPGRTLPPMHLVRFGTDIAACPPGAIAPPAEPYFVTLGTIEPRKNHLLLLNLWREMPKGPRLVIIGRRGWESEAACRLLDRHTAFRGQVEEAGRLDDGQTAALLRGACALLFPTFVEGYGIPLAEALTMGVPAICSDIPSLRELGDGVPDFVDPLDGPGWREAILDYAEPDSPRRAAQLARIPGWHPPSWEAHFAAVERAITTLA
ncbi:glycosyltransferase family 1 protein [Roseococcus sp. SYP-B2431]|uniref:glycosyltransferase family 4 protein n=1 Tax=Roseococcus sp. SYP-B2431 TaxID=2496640 RepID=UPI00103C9DD9|nr:glycosyltransferase family 1 protein [Roseococcus sp. SYP-B2431]TCH96481.1 glycosyltransferase family 1 protein [Roseococcus sp. SYP-B2431]